MINLDKEGKYFYNQLKGVISPKVACNVNAVCCAFETAQQSTDCWDSIKNYKPEYTRAPDKFIYYLRNDNLIRELYKSVNKDYYNNWINDKSKDKFLYSDNSYPPNEIIKVLAIGFNLFMNRSGDLYKNYCEVSLLTEDEIKDKLNNKHPIVASFNLNNYGHIMTIIGYNDKGFLVHDSYGMSYLKEHERIGKAVVIPYSQFKEICKPKNTKKLCICF